MTRSRYTIFSSGKIGTLSIANRIVRSATCDYKMAPDGSVTQDVIDIYAGLGAGGAGLIITGLMAVSENAKAVHGQPCIFSDEHIEHAGRIAHAVHSASKGRSRVFAQICHPGRQVTRDSTQCVCVAPSAVPSPILDRTAEELTAEQIERIERIAEDFVSAVVRVKKAGFDGVQLHAAHGYLLSSFLSPYTNKRTDAYGGTPENRVRIISGIVRAARALTGDFPIIVKMNCDDHVPGGIAEDTFPEIAALTAAAGVDAIEVSGGMWDCLAMTEDELGFTPVPIPESRTRIDTAEKRSYYHSYLRNVKIPVPVILVGGHRNVDEMEALLNSGVSDFLAMSRPFIAEPGLPGRWLRGEGSAHAGCVSCNACLVFKDEFGCALRRKKLNRAEFEKGFAAGWRAAFR